MKKITEVNIKKSIGEELRKKENVRRLIKAEIELLGRIHWDLWVTITFRTEMSVDSAKKSVKSFFKYLNKPGEHYFDKFIRCWIFYELDAAGDRIHVHMLINGIDSSLASELEEKCCEHFGDSKIEPYNYNYPDGSGIHYLARKIGSPRLVNREYFKINSKLRKRVKSYSRKPYEVVQ